MTINNFDYGGFVVSKNILNGQPVKYTFREKSEISQLNGWTLYSDIDDEAYVNDFQNFTIVSATSIQKLIPVMLEIYAAPYGTDLCWLYEDGVHVGFYDLVNDKTVTIDELVEMK